MAKKISGSPTFDTLQLMKLLVTRGPRSDEVEATIAYVSSQTHEMFGSVQLALGNLSKQSKELLSNLYSSIEEDAAVAIFGESKEEKEKEGIHNVKEPEGIVAAAEEADQI